MADKKSDRRFTLQFNKKDPTHRQVADILNRLEWRGKAQYVVNAVLHYISRGDSPEVKRPALDERQIEAVVSRMLQDWRENGAGALPVPSPAGQIDDPSSVGLVPVMRSSMTTQWIRSARMGTTPSPARLICSG